MTFLYLTKYYAMKTYGALVGGEWLASLPSRFTPDKDPSTLIE
jgi:hypothetical protein